ncbi:hypothetical protein TMatcc_004478 [Talaromyces marneffei ATCC 18224]
MNITRIRKKKKEAWRECSLTFIQPGQQTFYLPEPRGIISSSSSSGTSKTSRNPPPKESISVNEAPKTQVIVKFFT